MNLVKNVFGAFFAMVLVLGVSGSLQAQDAAAVTEEGIIGTWGADFAAMLEGEEMTPEERAAVEGMIAGAVANMSINADHTANYHAEMMGEVEDKAGVWALDPTTSQLTIVDNTSGEVVTMTVSAPDADTLIMTSPEGESMVWRRAAAAAE